jgi:hypothetical protein
MHFLACYFGVGLLVGPLFGVLVLGALVGPFVGTGIGPLVGPDKKNKRIGSRETTRDCDSGFSLRASLAIYIYGDCGSPYSPYRSY